MRALPTQSIYFASAPDFALELFLFHLAAGSHLVRMERKQTPNALGADETAV